MFAQALSPAEAAELDALIRAPERVEIHSRDRGWTNSVLAAVISAACITFGAAPAARADASGTFAANNREAWSLVRDVSARRVAEQTSPTMDVTLNVVGFPAGGDQNLPQIARDFVYAREAALMVNRQAHPAVSPDLPLVRGMRMGGEEGRLLVYEAVLSGMENSDSPIATTYLAEGGHDKAACIITISNAHLPALNEMASASGLNLRQTRDMMVLHEAAHCAQNAEKLAALLDWSETGKVPQARYAGGMLGYQFERDLRAAARTADVQESRQAAERLNSPHYLRQRASTLSNERYAAGYAAVAMLVNGGLKHAEIPKLAEFLQTQDPDHRSGDFVRWIADQTKDPAVLKALREGAISFSPQGVARHVLPLWKQYEETEYQAARPTARADVDDPRNSLASLSNEARWPRDALRGTLARLRERVNVSASEDKPDQPRH